MVNTASWLAFVLLMTAISSAHADVEYEDTNLHRSDEMVRFDHAYRAGLKDGTTTIIYSEAKPPGSVPDVAPREKEARSTQRGSEARAFAQSDENTPRSSEYSRSDYERNAELPEKMQDPKFSERHKPEYEDRLRGLDDDCDCDRRDGTAPRGRPVAKGQPAEPDLGPTMEEQLEAVRKARELLRQSRGQSAESQQLADSIDEHASGKLAKPFGSDTPRITRDDNSVSPEEAPLTPYELDPDYVRNQKVNVDIPAATIEEIAKRLMPRGWRVRLSSSDPDKRNAKYEFVSSDPRDTAIRNLLHGTGLGYKMFFDLKDEHGNPTPLLVISEIHS